MRIIFYGMEAGSNESGQDRFFCNLSSYFFHFIAKLLILQCELKAVLGCVTLLYFLWGLRHAGISAGFACVVMLRKVSCLGMWFVMLRNLIHHTQECNKFTTTAAWLRWMCYYWKSAALVLILSQEAPKQLALSVVTGDDSAQARVPNASNKNLSVGEETRRQYTFVRTRLQTWSMMI